MNYVFSYPKRSVFQFLPESFNAWADADEVWSRETQTSGSPTPLCEAEGNIRRPPKRKHRQTRKIATLCQQIFDFIEAEVHAGRPTPTLREVARKFGFRAHRAVACHLEAIRKKGFIEWNKGKARTLRLVQNSKARRRPEIVEIPLFGTIPAGFGSETEQEADGCVAVDTETVGFKPTGRTFALRVIGDSMIGRHICGGDIVILEHEAEPRHGQIVAALIDGKSTLKTYILKNGRAFLKAEHPRYPDLIPSEELVVQGVFRALMRKARD